LLSWDTKRSQQDTHHKLMGSRNPALPTRPAHNTVQLTSLLTL
jgi:hypothetical protein